MVSAHFFQKPIWPLLIQTVERDRALDAVEVGAARSYMDRRSLLANLFEHLRGVALLGEQWR